MANARQTTTLLAVLAAVVVVVFGVVVFVNREATEVPTGPKVRRGDPARGPSDAAVTIVEFGDFQCSFCKESADALARLVAAFPEDVRHVWKDFPLPDHAQAQPAAVAARCAADQGEFWEFHDALFQRQGELGGDLYRVIASDLGLDFGRFSRCLEAQQRLPAVEQSLRDGQALGVSRVPTLFLNDQRFDEVLSFDDLRALVQAERVTAQ